MQACRAAEAGGAQYVKTSTGFHPAGGASVEAVRPMRETVGDRLGVKASGGIRDTATALAMLDAGATRLGLSGTRAVLDGLYAGGTARSSRHVGQPRLRHLRVQPVALGRDQVAQQPHVTGGREAGDLLVGEHPRHRGADLLGRRRAARTRWRRPARRPAGPRPRPASCGATPP